MVKKQKKTKVLKTVGFIHIKQLPEWSGNVMKGSTIGLFHGKKNLKQGFKNVNEAEEFINSKSYNVKEKKFV